MAVGIEERMVPHMENKKQDCKKIEELKRQYAGSEMSGEQVEQMKKRNRIGENIIFYTAAKLFWCPDGLIVKRRCEIVCFSPGKTIRNKR